MIALRPMLLLLLAPGVAAAQAPTVSVVEQSLNAGVELQYLDSQEVRDLAILAGGRTASGDYLYLCEGKLVWKIGIEELTEKIQLRGVEAGGRFGDLVAGVLVKRTGVFEKGDVVTKVRIRVRLERAGNDWIVTSAKFKEFDGNPLNRRSSD